ncbi:uncharacterized protein si:dkeyp-97a10.3 [Esox lucius]|uniref:Ig-like domain-containing protein n=1 Tax=Esox lucius TaxID=8010 RepID=A0A3P8YJY6_ESOLU|nr:uncharacterized protein si:dkeyp-97a10.3 [Esox lucius]
MPVVEHDKRDESFAFLANTMARHLPHVVLSLTVLLPTALSQSPVPVQFSTNPVLVQTGTNAVFTVITIPQVYSITWGYPGGGTPLGTWIGGGAQLNSVAQYQGRVNITATQLRISSAQLGDAGNYTALVAPLSTTGLIGNTGSVQLFVFDAVSGVNLLVPSVALEGGNVSLSCIWTKGTQVTVMWGKGGTALTSNSRITITGGNLVIYPANRADAGVYSCTVSNPVSAQTATMTLTVYYGPDTPVLSKASPADCVGGADALVGQTLQLTCSSSSLPPATFSWQYNSAQVASGSVFSLQTFSTNQSGQYTCVASNAITGTTSRTGINLSIVGTCLSAGAVAGIVIGCVVILVLIIVAIVLCVCWRRKKRRQNEAPGQKTTPDTILIPPARRSHPPLYGYHNYNAPVDGHNNTNTLQHNGHANRNGFPHNDRHQNPDSYPDNGTAQDQNTLTHAQNANTLRTHPQMTQSHPNILIQAGTTQVGVNLNSQENNRTQQPTVHVNLNSYPANGQEPNEPSPRSLSRPGGTSRVNRSDLDTGLQASDGLIATGYTHSAPLSNVLHNGNTQTHRSGQDRQPRGASHSTNSSSSPHQQMPRNRLREIPAYPNNSPRGQTTAATQDGRAQTQITQAAPQSQTGPRQQSASHSHHNAQPQPKGPGAPQGPLTRGSTLDTRALADPNHFLPHTQAGIQQGSGDPLGERQHTPDQRQTVAQSQPVKQKSSGLTQTALERHEQTTPNPFRNRNHQTQAALLNSQAQGPNRRHKRPPSPPPTIPLAQFQTIPRDRTQYPGATRPTNVPRHQNGNGHHVQAGNIHRHGQHTHGLPAHPRQQTRQGRPRR